MEVTDADAPGIARAADVLAAGGIVIHPTETCYGIACNMLDQRAVARLFEIKKRPPAMPVSALFPDMALAGQVVEWPSGALALAEKYLPGPLTIIVPVRAGVTIFTMPEDPAMTLGVRVSPHPVAFALAQACPFPVSTTSANLHGEKEPYDIAAIKEQYPHGGPDLVLDGGTLPPAPPSTIVAADKGKITLVRQGSIVLE